MKRYAKKMKKGRATICFLLLISLLSMWTAALLAAPVNDTVYLDAANQADQATLLSLLNGRVTSGGKKYVLKSDFIFQSSDLLDTYFPGKGRESRTRYATFLSSLDGNGKTIAVNVEKEDSSRPLFHTIGDLLGERIAIQNLTVHYRGDVKVTAFLSGYARNTDFRNITIKVDGDVVASADYFNNNVDFYAHAFGYSAEKCTFKNIKIQVGNGTESGIIGQTSKTIAERINLPEIAKSATYAYGFFHDMTDVSISNVTIAAKQINATGDVGARAAGFAETVKAGKENAVEAVQVNISGSILAKQQSYGNADTVGAYGFARRFDSLTKSNISAAGVYADNKNILTESDFLTEAAAFGGVLGDGELRIFENAATISGSVTATSGGLLSATGGYLTDLMGTSDFHTEKNTVTVGGDVRAAGGSLLKQKSDAKSNIRVSGFSHGAADVYSSGDRVNIAGSVSGVSEGASAVEVSGYAAATADVEETVVALGEMTAKAPGQIASLSGFATAIKRGATQKNNYILIDGKLEASTVDSVEIAGYTASFPGRNTSIEGCTVDIGGNIYVESAGEAPEISVSGFSSGNSGATIAQCAVVIEENIEVRADAEKGSVTAAVFLGAMDAGTLSQNAAYHIGSSVIGGMKGTVLKSNFVAVLKAGTVSENAIFGPAGIEEQPKEFLISTLQENGAGYRVADNYYVAVHGGDRVSHPIDFLGADDTRPLTVKLETLTAPLARLTVDMQSNTLTKYSDGMQGTLVTFGSPSLSEMAGQAAPTVERKPLLDNKTLLPVIVLASKNGDKMVIRDIVGVSAGGAETISGLIFYDNDNNGRFDALDSYTPTVDFDVVAFEEKVKVVTTARDGRFSFEMPLVSAMKTDYHLNMKIPAGYVASQLSVNKFRNGVAYIPDYQYDKSYANVNGALAPEKAYTVTFSMNGGSVVASQKVYESEKAVRPDDPLRAGYLFSGWYADSLYANPYDFQLPVYKNLTLYAKWTKTEGVSALVLSFNGDGSTGGTVPKATEQAVETEITIPVDVPEKEGYTFDGWLASHDNKVYVAGQDFQMPNQSVEMKAQWKPIGGVVYYTVRFEADGGNQISPITGVGKDEKIESPPIPTKDGYRFGGWFTERSYETAWDFLTDTVEGDTTLYAKWLPPEESENVTEPPSQSLGQSGTPLSGISGNGWGIANLVFVVVGFVLAAFMTIVAVRDFHAAERKRASVRLLLSFFSIAVSILSAIIFLVSSDLNSSPSVINNWTWVMVLLTAAEGVLCIISQKPIDRE